MAGKHGAMDRASDSEYMNDSRHWFKSNWCQNLCDASCALKGCGMGPWLVLSLFPLVLGKIKLPHAKLGLFCVV